MPNAISTQDKLEYIAAFATAATPIFEKLQQNVSDAFTAGSSDTIRVELDGYPIFTDGATVSADSDILIKDVDVTMGIVATTLSMSAINKELDIADFKRQVAKPAGVAFAAKSESKLANEIIYNAENVSVSTGTFAQLSAVQSAIEDTKLGKQMIGFLPPSLYNLVANSGVNLFGPSLGEKLYAGELGNYLGCDYFKSTDLPVIRTGAVVPTTSTTVTATVGVDGATQLALGTLSAATGTLAKGTVFALTGVYTKNLLGENTAQPRYFVVKYDATVTGSAATVTVSPIYFSKASGVQDPRANVSVTSIASGTTVSIAPQIANSTYLTGIVFDPAVVAYGAKRLANYDGIESSESIAAGSVTLRMGSMPDLSNGSQKIRLDSMLGFKSVLAKGTGITMVKVA